MSMDLLRQIADEYERKARLAPALLGVSPTFAVLVFYYGIEVNLTKVLLSTLASIGLFYLLASVAREAGKRAEAGLYAGWGGKPSTLLLRHRDRTFEPVSKKRMHEFLASKIGVPLPSADEERANKKAADHAYESATNWLREATRDKSKFNLLFKENVAYGFRRNGHGLKPISILICLISILWVEISSGTANFIEVDLRAMPVGGWIAIGISVLALLIWVFFFTQKSVKSAAFSYADALLRCCDKLNLKA